MRRSKARRSVARPMLRKMLRNLRNKKSPAPAEAGRGQVGEERPMWADGGAAL